jgi:hypothetical protein
MSETTTDTPSRVRLTPAERKERKVAKLEVRVEKARNSIDQILKRAEKAAAVAAKAQVKADAARARVALLERQVEHARSEPLPEDVVQGELVFDAQDLIDGDDDGDDDFDDDDNV